MAAWKKETANVIANSTLFKDLLPDKLSNPDGASPDEWIKRIVKKLENFLTAGRAAKRVGITEPNTARGQSSATSGDESNDHGHGNAKSMFQRRTLTGLGLFNIRKNDEIAAEATRRAQAAGGRSNSEYARQASVLKNDVGMNQRSFKDDIWADMDEFAKSKVVGNVSMTLLWSFQTPEDTTETGMVCVNSLKGKPSFDAFCDQWEDLWSSWERYSAVCLPKWEATRTAVSIPRDADGTPVFPELDIDTTAGGAAGEVLRDFIRQLWEHCRPCDPFTWDGAASQYDKTRFQLPGDVTMESVKSLTGSKALGLAEYFMKQQETARFVFEAESEGEDSDEEEPVAGKGKGKGQAGGKNNDAVPPAPPSEAPKGKDAAPPAPPPEHPKGKDVAAPVSPPEDPKGKDAAPPAPPAEAPKGKDAAAPVSPPEDSKNDHSPADEAGTSGGKKAKKSVKPKKIAKAADDGGNKEPTKKRGRSAKHDQDKPDKPAKRPRVQPAPANPAPDFVPRKKQKVWTLENLSTGETTDVFYENKVPYTLDGNRYAEDVED
ncbi:hypothetical protein C8F04DRAFT_1264567 [Mycena alexandri]|uniref:Uncharacterized protein n=1 Tax=Mycena alexandri TaxID=1745969 RepID=A0AAD6WWD5_9AGAR|nr:hypothetical protein C8F04DRAFT_1264567 [Mycena alexandri]